MSASRNPHLSALFVTAPELAIQTVRNAIKAAEGNYTAAAVALRVNRKTLFRWASKYPKIRAVPRRPRLKT